MNVPPREGGAVPDGLSYRNGHPSVLGFLRPGLPEQPRPFHGPWVSMQQVTIDYDRWVNKGFEF